MGACINTKEKGGEQETGWSMCKATGSRIRIVFWRVKFPWYQVHRILLFLSSLKKKKSYRIYIPLKKENSICFSFLKFIINTGQRITPSRSRAVTSKNMLFLWLQWIIFSALSDKNCSCVIGRVQGGREVSWVFSNFLKFYNQVAITAQSHKLSTFTLLPQLCPNILKNRTDAQRFSPQIPGRRKGDELGRGLESWRIWKNHDNFSMEGGNPQNFHF